MHFGFVCCHCERYGQELCRKFQPEWQTHGRPDMQTCELALQTSFSGCGISQTTFLWQGLGPVGTQQMHLGAAIEN